MTTTRLKAFSDAVLAIVITIMVLELPAPHHPTLAGLEPALPPLLTYLLSFVFLGIYWNNHHHMMQVVDRVNGSVLWANLHLLFWLSLVPFVTGWMGESRLAALPTAACGLVLIMAAAAYAVLQTAVIRFHGPESRLARAVGRGRKELVSLVAYAAAIGLAFVEPWIAAGLYIFVALIWLIPDPRIEALME